MSQMFFYMSGMSNKIPPHLYQTYDTPNHHQHPIGSKQKGTALGFSLRRSGLDLKITLLAGRGDRRETKVRQPLPESTVFVSHGKQIDGDILPTSEGGKSS